MRSKTILIIDDDEDDKIIFEEVLNEIDPTYTCLFGTNGAHGLEILHSLKKQLPEFIFLDLNMPQMNGKQCLAEIKRNKKFSSIPVIIYSTSKLENDITETKLLGASYFLTKPSLFSDLKEAIRLVLSGDIRNHSADKDLLEAL
jgi:CheY-like chemotaxis protein